MDFQKNRLAIGAVLLVVLGGLAVWAVNAKTGDTPVHQSASDGFPEVERDSIATLEIKRPEDEAPVILTRGESDAWRVTQPVEAEADASNVSEVLSKLADLAPARIVATGEDVFDDLEVDTEHGVHVVAKSAGGETLMDLWIGKYGSQQTMIRIEGDERVIGVSGSIKFAFNRPLRDWRDRGMLDLTAEDVREAVWTSPNHTFAFVRSETASAEPTEAEGAEAGEDSEASEAEGSSGPEGSSGESTEAEAGPTLGEWQVREVSYQPDAPSAPGEPGAEPAAVRTELEHFAASKVRTFISSLATMRANDFADPGTDAASAGIGDESPRVTLTTADGSFTVRLGNALPGENRGFFAQVEGDPTIFQISSFLGERVDPGASAFQESAAPPAAPAGGPGAELGGNNLPPEVMEQLRRQLEQQGQHP